MQAGPTKSNNTLKVLLIIGGIFAALIAMGVVAAVAIYGVQKYVNNSKTADIDAQAQQLATTQCQCSQDGELPESTGPVPQLVPSGRNHLADQAEWEKAGFCAGLDTPQYGQYRWIRESATRGYLTAVADLDGDGDIGDDEPSLRIPAVLAADGSCSVGKGRVAPAPTDVAVATNQGGTFQTTDGAMSIKVPSTYEPLDMADAVAGTSLFVGNEMSERYLMVLPESSADFVEKPSAAEYVKLLTQGMNESGSGEAVGPIQSRTINGFDAADQRFQGVVDNLRISYLVTGIKTPDSYQQILQWTLASQYDDAVASFRSIADTAVIANPGK